MAAKDWADFTVTLTETAGSDPWKGMTNTKWEHSQHE